MNNWFMTILIKSKVKKNKCAINGVDKTVGTEACTQYIQN